MFDYPYSYRVKNETKRNEITRLREKIKGLERENKELKTRLKSTETLGNVL